MKTLLLSVFTAMVFVSIYSCECYNSCGKMDYKVELNIVGFSDTEITPLILKAYAKGSGFTQLIDSSIFDDFDNDTRNQDGLTINTIGLMDTRDKVEYIIEIPSVGRNYQLTNTLFEKEECRKCGKKTIINTLKSYTLNGVLMTTDGSMEIKE